MGEIRDLMDSYARNERRRVRDEIAARYELADLIGMYIQLPYDTDIQSGFRVYGTHTLPFLKMKE